MRQGCISLPSIVPYRYRNTGIMSHRIYVIHAQNLNIFLCARMVKYTEHMCALPTNKMAQDGQPLHRCDLAEVGRQERLVVQRGKLQKKNFSSYKIDFPFGSQHGCSPTLGTRHLAAVALRIRTHSVWLHCVRLPGWSRLHAPGRTRCAHEIQS